MNRIRKPGQMVNEVLSNKNWTAEEGNQIKGFFYDVIRQARKSGAICSVDPDNCYDHVARAILSLIYQVHGVSNSSVGTMLKAIQEMKFFPTYRVWGLKRLCGSHNRNKITMVMPREKGSTCGMGSG